METPNNFLIKTQVQTYGVPALAFFDQLSGVYSVTAFKITVKPTVAGFLAVFLQTVLLTEGVSVLENLRAITLVCQSYNLFPLPTAEENVQHPMPPRKVPGPGGSAPLTFADGDAMMLSVPCSAPQRAAKREADAISARSRRCESPAKLHGANAGH